MLLLQHLIFKHFFIKHLLSAFSLSVLLEISSKIIHLVNIIIKQQRLLERSLVHTCTHLFLFLLKLLFWLGLDAFSFKRIFNWNKDSIFSLFDKSFIKHLAAELSVVFFFLIDLCSLLSLLLQFIILCQLFCYLFLLPFLGCFLFFYLCFRSSSLWIVFQ